MPDQALVPPPPVQSPARRPVRRRVLRLRCPHCGSSKVQGHGYFRWKDGTVRPRQLCRNCGHTSNPSTGTAIHYIKKRAEWKAQAEGLGECLSLRRMAANLRVSVPTVFRWRHRVMAAVAAQPQPLLPAEALVDHAFVRYSEKGSRKTTGPGSWGARENAHLPLRQQFRRFIHGKPSFVLLVGDDERLAATVVGQGSPAPDVLGSCLARLIASPDGAAPSAEVCRRLGEEYLHCRGMLPRVGTGPLRKPLPCFGSWLYSWLKRFRGVATRYLANYLVWYCHLNRPGQPGPEQIGRDLLRLSCLRRPPQFRETDPMTGHARGEGAKKRGASPHPA